MKKTFLILLLLAAPVLASAQYWTSLDRDIKGMRDQLAPDFSLDYGDWVQYGPGVVTYGMKAFGLESRSGWGRMLTSQILGTGLLVAIDGGLKYVVGRERPNFSANNSFPSGHTATVFLTAGWLHTEYGWRYPWVDAIGYGLGVTTAVQRLLSNMHWATDTMAGAAVGMFANFAGYWLADRILGNREGFWGISPNWSAPEVDYDQALKYFEAEFFYTLSFPLWQNSLYPASGSGMGVQARVPYGTKGRGILVRGSVTGFSLDNGNDFDMSWFAGAGSGRELLLAPRWEAGLYALAGCSHWESGHRFAGIAGASMSYIAGYSSKLKLFAEYALHPHNGVSGSTDFHSVNVGASAVLYF